MLLPVALLAACATGSSVRESVDPEPGVVPVGITNDLRPRTAITVRIISSSGKRTVLGIVSPGSTKTLRFEESFLESTYQLRAETTEGRHVTSRRFEIFANAAVHWTLSRNIIEVRIP